jgi:Zn-dependent protease
MEIFLLVLAGWVFSVCLHEFGHALVAYYGGDYTVREKGYLTLNPLHYTHPVYSLVMPVVFVLLGGIGLPGGAVYIRDDLLRSRQWRSAVSLAGPAMNLVLILVLCLPFWLGIVHDKLAPALALLIQLQIWSVLLNLLPIPPLDGFGALSPWLPGEMRESLLQKSNLFLFILFILMWNVPVVSHAFGTVVYSISDLCRIDYDLIRQGWWQFQFWHH